MKKQLISCITLVLLSSCAAKELNPAANKVHVSHSKPSGHCEYLGNVTGDQGNFLTGGYTSNRNLELGAINDLKNQAYAMGATHVELLTNRAGQSGSSHNGNGSFSQTTAVLVGNAYRCK